MVPYPPITRVLIVTNLVDSGCTACMARLLGKLENGHACPNHPLEPNQPQLGGWNPTA